MSGQERQQGARPRVIHGARSEVLKSADIARIERRLKERFGIRRLRDLTGFQRYCVLEFARAERILERYDRELDRIGPLKADGNPRAFMAAYNAALNSAGKALQRLEESLGQTSRQRSREDTLRELSKYRGQPGA